MTPSTAFLNALKAKLSGGGFPPDAYTLVAAATATTLGRGHTWLPAIYRHATNEFPVPKDPVQPSPVAFKDDPLPRRRVVRRLKEAVFKCTILCGVGKVIETSLALKDAVMPQDQDTTVVRKDFDLGETNDERGMAGLRRVYRSNLDNIFERFGPELAELQWLSTKVTYGLFLSPTSEDTPSEPLTFPETEIIVLSSLAAQGAARETLWHLRGCLRAGFSAEDVETLQQAIEMTAKECGTDMSAMQLPRVKDVTEEDDLS